MHPQPAVSANCPSIDLTPVSKLLATRFDNDPKEVAARLHEVQSYLMHEPSPNDTAARLRYIVGIVGALASAFDSATVSA